MRSRGSQIISNIMSVILAALLCLSAFSVTSNATFYKSENDLADAIDKTIPIIEEIFQKKKDRAQEALKGFIKENGWDYEYTMQAFFDEGNPYKNYDYDALIAAYATIGEFGRKDKGLLSEVPMLTMNLKEEPVPGDEEKTYAVPTFKVMDAKGLIEYYGYKEHKKVNAVFEKKLQKIEDALSNENIIQQVFLTTPESVASDETDYTKFLQLIPSDITEYERLVVETALSLTGQVPYQWGGKAKSGGYDTSWWTFIDGEQKGLDCSGFVQWVFMTIGFGKEITDKLVSTSSMLSNVDEISVSELRPGDIGIKNHTNKDINHCGIYLGNDLWIHCSSSKNTVVCSTFDFRFFYRVGGVDSADNEVYNEVEYTYKNTEDDVGENGENSPLSNFNPAAISLNGREYDIDLLARLIEHEAGNQGYNGWVAVGEVVLNRVLSPLFPDTIERVIYQTKQFTNSSELKNVSPREGIKEVAAQLIKGTVRIFNNTDVMYFRNPKGLGLKATDPVDWDKNKWFTAVGDHAFYTQG